MISDHPFEFRRSTYCSGSTCVEVAPQPNGEIALRDSKNPTRETHVFSLLEWIEFIRGVKAGEFDFDSLSAG